LRELALHILDIAENGIQAGADLVQLEVREDRGTNRLDIRIGDNGRGMSAEVLARVTDPFFSTKRAKGIGLGLALLGAAARRCGGGLEVHSRPGSGTEVRAGFMLDHVDRAPVGDMGSTLTTLILGNPGVNFVYSHTVDGACFELDTRELREGPDDDTLEDPRVLKELARTIREAVAALHGA